MITINGKEYECINEYISKNLETNLLTTVIAGGKFPQIYITYFLSDLENWFEHVNDYNELIINQHLTCQQALHSARYIIDNELINAL